VEATKAISNYMMFLLVEDPSMLPSPVRSRLEVFYGTQYDLYDRLKKDSYVIEKDLYVRIRRLRLILYD
jgi:DNA polymerase III delta prime subunit